MKKSKIVKHFEKDEIARQTIYNTINRMQNQGSIKYKKKTCRSTSWTVARRSQLKRLVNNRKGVSQRHLDHSVISRKISEMGIYNNKREKTPK